MSKKVRQQRKHKPPRRERLVSRKAVIAVTLLLILSVAGVIAARWGDAPSVFTHMTSAPLVPTPTPTPSPAKEYIYAGSKLVATEEPKPVPAPPPGGVTEAITWANVVGATASGNGLTKTATAGWGNSGAVSTRALASGDGFVEFTAEEANTARVCGFSDADSAQTYQDIKYGINAHLSGNIYIYESGVQRSQNGNTSFGTYAAGDTFRVAVEGGVVKYYQNSTLLYTSAVAPTYPLLVDTALYSAGATISDAYLAGSLATVLPDGTVLRDVTWTNLVGATASGSDLTKTGTTTGWNAGASSTQSLASGDGFVEFTTGEANTAKICGLSDTDSSQVIADIKYGFDLHLSGNIYIYESGVQRSVGGNTSFGTYAAGDKFRVAVEGGVVKYYRNSTLLYTSTVAPTYPLLVDASFYNTGATVKGAVVAGFGP
jgi:hypothetical protein